MSVKPEPRVVNEYDLKRLRFKYTPAYLAQKHILVREWMAHLPDFVPGGKAGLACDLLEEEHDVRRRYGRDHGWHFAKYVASIAHLVLDRTLVCTDAFKLRNASDYKRRVAEMHSLGALLKLMTRGNPIVGELVSKPRVWLILGA